MIALTASFVPRLILGSTCQTPAVHNSAPSTTHSSNLSRIIDGICVNEIARIDEIARGGAKTNQIKVQLTDNLVNLASEIKGYAPDLGFRGLFVPSPRLLNLL